MKKILALAAALLMVAGVCTAQEVNKIRTIQLGENFYCIDDPGSRQFFFVGTDKVILVDTGFGKYKLTPVIRKISDLPIEVVLTHGHVDHIGGLQEFGECYACEKDFPMLPENIKKKPLKDGDKIDIGNFVFDIIEIPGHTEGSIILLEKNKKFMIAGDSVQEGPIYMFGDISKFDTYIESMQKLMEYSASAEKIYSAHNTLSYGPEYIQYCIEDAMLFREGKITPEKTEIHGRKCNVYRGQHVSFFAD